MFLTPSAHEAALVSKIFILNFITSYLPIFLTAFVYVPFGQIIVPHLDVFSLTVRPFAEDEKQLTAPKAGFQINPDRLKKQIIYFTVTAQIVNFLAEIIVPYVSRRVFRKVKEVKADRAMKKSGTASPTADDHPEEAAFLVRVRNEAELSAYDVTTDFREMIVQFGTFLKKLLVMYLIFSRISIPLLSHLATDCGIILGQQLDRAPR
jgi:anoctamin-10